MERYCSTGQSPQQAVAPTGEEEEVQAKNFIVISNLLFPDNSLLQRCDLSLMCYDTVQSSGV
jgi:hypothetical protein